MKALRLQNIMGLPDGTSGALNDAASAVWNHTGSGYAGVPICYPWADGPRRSFRTSPTRNVKPLRSK